MWRWEAKVITLIHSYNVAVTLHIAETYITLCFYGLKLQVFDDKNEGLLRNVHILSLSFH
jgi:hypothetical protein